MAYFAYGSNADEEYEVLFETQESGMSYETNEFIVAVKDDRVYWGSDGGCSCYEGFNPEYFTTGDRASLLNAYDAWAPSDQPKQDLADLVVAIQGRF